MDIRSGQKLAWENRAAKGFSTTGVPLEVCLLQGEIAEAFDPWRRGRLDAGEELADVAIYLLGLAEMTGVDLQHQIEAKMAKNAARMPPPAGRRPHQGHWGLHHSRPHHAARPDFRS